MYGTLTLQNRPAINEVGLLPFMTFKCITKPVVSKHLLLCCWSIGPISMFEIHKMVVFLFLIYGHEVMYQM